MRKKQAELNFHDSFYRDFDPGKELQRLGRVEDLTYNHPEPMPRMRHRLKLICLECSTLSSSSSAIPTCPGCGGSDLELR